MVESQSLINVDRLQALLREGTGRGVRVAILDTGIDASHPALEGAVRGSWEVVHSGGRLVCRSAQSSDLVGHGTACAGIIHMIAPDAELYSVRVMGADASGTGDQLLHGLNWAISQNMDVINLSLGTMQKRLY